MIVFRIISAWLKRLELRLIADVVNLERVGGLSVQEARARIAKL